MSVDAISNDAVLTSAGNPLRVSVLTNDVSNWDKFVTGHDDGTFYHLSGWRSIIENVLGHKTWYLYCESNGAISGILPLAQVKSTLFGNALISLPFLVYGGLVANDPESESALLQHARDLADKLDVDYLELRNRRPLAGDWLTKDVYVTFRKTIEPDAEKNMQAIPRKQRAMIRKGINAGLSAEIDDDTGRLYSAMLACKRNLGTPFFGASWLKAIKDEFGNQVEVTTITHNGATVCSVMSFRYCNQILPYYGGGGDLARDLKGNDFMYWAVMEKACREGVEIFDYGRSMVGSGAFHFKKHWGFEPEPLAYQYYLVKAKEMPSLNPSNPRYRLLINIWKRLPLMVAGVLGPPIARRLG